MSTRCNIELYDTWHKEDGKPGVILYHHSDGYPEFMYGKLKRFLIAVYEQLEESGHPYWWDTERVAAVLIALSIEDYEQPLKAFSTHRANSYSDMPANILFTDKGGQYRPNGGVPVFQPCMALHGDIEYIWKVYLGNEGEFEIRCVGLYENKEVDLEKYEQEFEESKTDS